jgi:hypothetical protein
MMVLLLIAKGKVFWTVFFFLGIFVCSQFVDHPYEDVEKVMIIP